MTERQKQLVHDLRVKLFHHNYPPIFIVTNEELCATEDYLIEELQKRNEPTILKCGKHGLYFKGCELVLEVKD